MNFELMVNELKSKQAKKIAVAVAEDEVVLKAICEAKNAGIADSILVGNEENIKNIAKEYDLNIDGLK